MPPPLRVVTWNLLHPIWGQKYDEFPMRAANYRETNRIDNITSTLRIIIESRYENEILLVALQEVSLAQLRSVETLAASLGGEIYYFQLDDMPALDTAKARPGYSGDGHPPHMAVFVAVLAFGAKISNADGASFGNDQGKGYCVIDVPDSSLTFISTHVSYGSNKRGSQLQELLDVYTSSSRNMHTTHEITVQRHGRLKVQHPAAIIARILFPAAPGRSLGAPLDIVLIVHPLVHLVADAHVQDRTDSVLVNQSERLA